MKTTLIPLIGDPIENLYHLGKKEAESFLKIEQKVIRLLSTNSFLRYGQDIISRTRAIMKKKEETFFDQCIKAYTEGMGIEVTRYMSFISMFELAAHYGQVYPELKGLLPGCTSLFEKTHEGITHSRLLDFPLIGMFDEAPRLYYWKCQGKPSVLNYSCEGMAPLFFHAIHEGGFSNALHHKPGESYHKDGFSIFQITFETLFEIHNMTEFRRELRKKVSMTKWGFYMVEKDGPVHAIDIDGPAMNVESYHLNETPSLIFTNIPIQLDSQGPQNFLGFCRDRQEWLKEKLKSRKDQHPLDLMTDVSDQKIRKWHHPSATLSTIGAIHVNLTKGTVDIKGGAGALVASDEILEFSLSDARDIKVIKPLKAFNDFEKAWKKASLAQNYFDQGRMEEAYHYLQIAISLMPHQTWKEIFSFYLYLWDFKSISNKKELSIIYKKIRKLQLPEMMKDQWNLLCMRMEKRLDLVPTIQVEDVGITVRELFLQEKTATPALFGAWMKLIYPRMEILDVFSPHDR